MKILGLAFILLFLVGWPSCSTRTTETGTVSGQVNGQPIALNWTRDADGQTKLNIPPLAAAAGLLPSPWGDLITIGMTLLGGAGMAAARSAGKRADEHKADAAEGWKLALAKDPDVQPS